MLYLMFMMILAGTCDRAALFNDYMIAEKVWNVEMIELVRRHHTLLNESLTLHVFL